MSVKLAFNPETKPSRATRELLIGIGNNGRSDDGIGWAFAEAVEKSGIFKGDVLLKYQLQIEDAELISDYDVVYFVDATEESLENGYSIETLRSDLSFTYTSHALVPGAIKALCSELYPEVPRCMVVKISGEAWDLAIGMSENGQKNLDHALKGFNRYLNSNEQINHKELQYQN